MKAGLGVHSSPVQILAPRSLTGQMKYLYRIKTFVIRKPKMMVQIQAPTKPSTVFLGESLMS